MKDTSEVKILAVVGMSGSGKSEVVGALAARGIPKVTERAAEEIRSLVAAGQKHIVLDGVSSWEEHKALKKEFPVVVLAVVAGKKLRRERVAKRSTQPLSTQEFQERDKYEIEELRKGGSIAVADYYILNEGTRAELLENVDKILREVGI